MRADDQDVSTPVAPAAVEGRPASTARVGAPTGSRRILAFSSSREFLRHYTIILILLALVAIFGIFKTSTFFTVGDLQTILTTQAALFALSLSLTVALAAGELDLSVGGAVGFSGVLIGYFSAVLGLSPWLALGLSFLAALLVGVVNSVLVVRMGVNGLITTLAMGTLLDGLSEGISKSTTITGMPSSLLNPMQAHLLGVGLPFWYTVAICAVMWYIMHHMRSGRFLYFTGEGREAARLAGIRVNRIRVIALCVSAVGAWLAGYIVVGQTGAAQAGIGDSYLLPGYAAAFLGAATIKPGRFNPLGTYVSVLLLAVGTTGLQLFGFASWVTNVFDGGVLMVAVGFATLLGA